MSTRSRIGIIIGTTIHSIYVHSDGYWSYNGRLLRDHWKTATKVANLITFGDASVLGEVIGKKHDFEWRSHVKMEDWAADKRSKMCRFYMRDRAEEGCEPQLAASIEEFVEQTNDCNGEYAYLFDAESETWFTTQLDGKWYLLSEAVAADATVEEPDTWTDVTRDKYHAAKAAAYAKMTVVTVPFFADKNAALAAEHSNNAAYGVF